MLVTCWNFPEPTSIMRSLGFRKCLRFQNWNTECAWKPPPLRPFSLCFQGSRGGGGGGGWGAAHTLLAPHQAPRCVGRCENIRCYSCASRWNVLRIWATAELLLGAKRPLSRAAFGMKRDKPMAASPWATLLSLLTEDAHFSPHFPIFASRKL